jgi:hypothetical protein
MILQVLANAVRIDHDGYVVFLQQIRRTYTRQLQNLWRTNRTSREQSFMRCLRKPALPAAGKFNAFANGTALPLFYTQTLHMAARHDFKVAVTTLHRAQKSFRRVPPYAATLIHFEVTAAFVITPIEIVDFRYTRLRSGISERIKNVPTQALLLYAPFTTRPMEFITAGMVIFGMYQQR